MSHRMTSDLHRASCACGQVQVHATGEPYRIGLCHCFDCRKAHSAPFAAFVIFPADRVRVTSADGSALAEGVLRSFGRSSEYRRYFCTGCGSHVFGQSKGSDEIELHLGSFDETNLWTPTYEAWARRREGWLGDLPTLRRHYVENREDSGHQE